MRQLIQKIVKLQNEFNKTIDANWIDNENMNFRRACWLECAELMNSTNWKWWKNQQTDAQNIEVELVDILHFVISQILRNNIRQVRNNTDCVEFVKKGMYHTIEDFLDTIKLFNDNQEFDEDVFRIRTESLARVCLMYLDDDLLENFVKLVNVSPTNIENVLKMYIAKNVLNKFRQDNGYKDGSYIKKWGKVEDNVVCWNLAKKIEPTEKFEKELYRQLGVYYEMVKQNKQRNV